MKTLPVATFNVLAPAVQLRTQFEQVGIHAVIHDESKLERFWFMSEPLAAVHIEVSQPDYLKARTMLGEWEKSSDLMRTAVRCPECQSSRVEFPQATRKFATPALAHMLMIALHLVPREYYCMDCHFTWLKTPKIEPELDVLGWPMNSKLWHPERFRKQPK
jgi:hypothetical protein